MSNFRPTDRQTGFLMLTSVADWLPQRHVARFVVVVVDGLDLRTMSGAYRGSGSTSCHPHHRVSANQIIPVEGICCAQSV